MPEAPVNFFSGNPLNRLSWLRTSHTFLNAIVSSPSTRWTLFKAGDPLMFSESLPESTANSPSESTSGQKRSNSKNKLSIAKLSTKHVQALLGPKPYFGQSQNAGSLVTIPKDEKHSPLEAARHLGPTVIFLGLDEHLQQQQLDRSSVHSTATTTQTTGTDTGSANGALPSSDFSDPDKAVANLQGTAYFALDVSSPGCDESIVQQVIRDAQNDLSNTQGQGHGQLIWAESRAVIVSSDPFEAALFAVGRSLTDWNLRNQFCAGCGSPVYSMWGGWKISCSSLLPWNKEKNIGKKICITSKGLHNFTHPRTDPVVIMVAIDETGERALLGKNFRYKGQMYSALAGFVEPGESFEDAVAREMWEEAGVKVTDTQYHSTQPWPYPANLMVGYYARADSSQPIRTDLDNELEDARWFTRDEILAVLSKNDPKAREQTISPSSHQQNSHSSFFVPPATAIAGVLLRDWAEGRVKFSSSKSSSSSYTHKSQRGHEKL